jgi:mannosyltransferase
MIELDGIIYRLQQHGGISVYFNELIDCLSRHDVDCSVSLYDMAELPVHAKVKVLSRRNRLLERYRFAPVSDGARLFHSSYYRTPSKRAGLRTVVTVHDFIYEQYWRGVRKHLHCTQKRMAIERADAVICVSNSTARDLKKFVGSVPGKIHVIPNGVSEKFYPMLKSNSGCSEFGSYLLFVGKRHGYKNFRLAADAMKFLPGMSLVCVGGEPFLQEEWANLDSSVRARIIPLRNVSDEHLNSLYNNAHCLVYPSLYEGFGIPVVEAMRAGCPVVVVRCDAVMEVGGDAVIVCEELVPKALAESIQYVGSSDRKNIIDRGITHALKYSWAATHEKTLGVYRQLLT